MDKYERIFRLHRILAGRRTPISMTTLRERLDDCSKATLYRDLAFLRDELGAPLDNDPESGGYRYHAGPDGDRYELPGLWFTADELQALVTFRELLGRLGSGLLEEHLAPFATRINELIRHRRLQLGELPGRVRLLGGAGRTPGAAFQVVASAVLERRELAFRYHSRSRDQHTERQVAPQRLVHYRDNWYLDAWDPKRKGLRTFAVERIGHARRLDARARDIPEAELDRHFGDAYGIFAGKANKTAILRFSAERARWVADEHWHPQQSGQFATDGTYELRIPYRDPTELIGEILRHGAGVEVLEPAELRGQVAGALRDALGRYDSAGRREV